MNRALRIGDEIEWSCVPPAGLPWDRLPNDTGIVPSGVECKNCWSDRGMVERGFFNPGQKDVVIDCKTPPSEIQKSFGCPDYMDIHVEVVNNRIKAVRFSKNSEEWNAEWRAYGNNGFASWRMSPGRDT